jgi:hypothetical protein
MTQERIRSALNACIDGLTLAEICIKAEMSRSHATAAVSGMTDVYIDRWTVERIKKVKREEIPIYAAVYMAAHVPDDCPKPQ